MTDSNSSNSGGGVGFFGLMFLVFLTLKLTDVIDWSWWWVTAPLWGGFALALVIVVVFFGISYFITNRQAKRIDSFVKEIRKDGPSSKNVWGSKIR